MCPFRMYALCNPQAFGYTPPLQTPQFIIPGNNTARCERAKNSLDPLTTAAVLAGRLLLLE